MTAATNVLSTTPYDLPVRRIALAVYHFDHHSVKISTGKDSFEDTLQLRRVRTRRFVKLKLPAMLLTIRASISQLARRTNTCIGDQRLRTCS
jgi:hypothetical protein